MNDLLINPVYNALCSGDAHLSLGSQNVKFFDERVSPFVGFNHDYNVGFDELYELLPSNRKILYATPSFIPEPKGWLLLHEVEGLQFVFTGAAATSQDYTVPVPLSEEHVEQMTALTSLTRPGPFGSRTIEFGNYFGIFENDRLVAMTGQRLHVNNYTEISAVCTHPDHLGKGFAAALMRHQLALILELGQIPFLHVRADNNRAIALYERLGFVRQRPMNFYFLKRKD